MILRQEFEIASSSKKVWDRFKMKYAIVIEKAEDNCSTYVPDLPGCIFAINFRRQGRQATNKIIGVSGATVAYRNKFFQPG